MRLAKYIAGSGLVSRRRAEELITLGRVMVNGVIAQKAAVNIDPDTDCVQVDGRLIKPAQAVYFLLNKPRGYLCSVTDPHGRSTVIDLLEGVEERVYPVGRLDLDTEGLLIMTNDGNLTNLIIHPRYHIPKTYQAWVQGRVSEMELKNLRQGINLEDGITLPAQAKLLREDRGASLVELVLFEGRKRQVRRMFKAIGHPVVSLKRTELAFLTLKGLPLGKYRCLHPREINQLIALAHGTRGKKIIG